MKKTIVFLFSIILSSCAIEFETRREGLFFRRMPVYCYKTNMGAVHCFSTVEQCTNREMVEDFPVIRCQAVYPNEN